MKSSVFIKIPDHICSKITHIKLTAKAKGRVNGVVSFFMATLYKPTLNNASPKMGTR